ncbi:repeat element 17 protein [Diadegma fenestrale ichnovirus]|nr:repeat element 17 protein [Diadegma fenestrale ichnovirus]
MNTNGWGDVCGVLMLEAVSVNWKSRLAIPPECLCGRVTTIILRRYKMSRAPSTLASSTLEPDALPFDTILYMSKFLSFVDFYRFVQSLWFTQDEIDIIQSRLWRMSTYKITITSIEGKKMELEYNYDPFRTEDTRILINLDTLPPDFGVIAAPTVEKFTTITNLHNIIKIHIHSDRCSRRPEASCRCRWMNDHSHDNGALLKPSTDPCKCGYVHYYCSLHVKHWMDFYAATSVLLREMGRFSDVDTTQSFLQVLCNAIHM